MRKIRCCSLWIGLLLIAFSCQQDDEPSVRERAAADQKAIRDYMDTHTYFFGRIRPIGDAIAGREVPDKPFSQSDNTAELPSGIWIWTNKDNKAGTGSRPTATSRIRVHYEGTAVKAGKAFPVVGTQDKTGTPIPGSTLDRNATGRPIWIDLSDQAESWWAEVMPHYRATERPAEADYEVQGVAFIPSESGFGHRFIRGIPTDAILVYEFEIYEVEKADQ